MDHLRPTGARGWFVPNAVVRAVAKFGERPIGCVVVALLALLAGGIALALTRSLRTSFEVTFLTLVACFLCVVIGINLARAELLRRGGCPSMVGWWFRALWESRRSGGPEWTAIVRDGPSMFGGVRRDLVRVWRRERWTGDADHWSSHDGEEVDGKTVGLDDVAAAEIDRCLRRMRDGRWPNADRSGMCGGSPPSIWVFPRRGRPRVKQADLLDDDNPTSAAARAVRSAGHEGCHILVRLGVGFDDARLGATDLEITDAIGAHWPAEPWVSPEGERGVRWPRLGVAAAFNAAGRCVLLRAEHPATGVLVRGDDGDSVCHFDFEDDEFGGWTFETHLQLLRGWPSTRREDGIVEVPELGVRLLVDGGRSPTADELRDQIGSGNRGGVFGVLRAVELRPPPAIEPR